VLAKYEMRCRKSQSATEFAILIAALLAVFLPIFYLLSDYGLKSGSELLSSQINQIGTKIVDESREIFYLGLYSKEVITLNIPESIVSMKTFNVNSTSGVESYLIVNYRKEGFVINASFPSEVPMITGSCSQYPCFGGNTCWDCPFPSVAYTPGMKNFKRVSMLWEAGMAVNVTQVYI
jgi:hypothetical protein